MGLDFLSDEQLGTNTLETVWEDVVTSTRWELGIDEESLSSDKPLALNALRDIDQESGGAYPFMHTLRGQIGDTGQPLALPKEDLAHYEVIKGNLKDRLINALESRAQSFDHDQTCGLLPNVGL